MKVNNAMSLLELQNYCSGKGINIRIDFVGSAGAWRVTVNKSGDALVWIGIGRNIGEAMQDAFTKYERGE